MQDISEAERKIIEHFAQNVQQPPEDEAQRMEIAVKMLGLLIAMKKAKPEERSERARALAVSITEMEKVLAYFEHFVVKG